MNKVSTAVILGLVLLGIVAGLGYGLKSGFDAGCEALDLSQPVRLEVAEGASSRQIAGRLKQLGLIRSAFIFRALVFWYGLERRLRPGVYQFRDRVTPHEILEHLRRGRVAFVRVTIPEGYTLRMAAERFEAEGVASAAELLAALGEPARLQRWFAGMGEEITHAEGLVFPDTYTVERRVAPERLADQLLKVCAERVIAEMALASGPARDLTPYQLCIMASLVEKEAREEADRPLVASVFYNRLAKGMRLESCATVIYALPYDTQRLTFADLAIDSPYNTYRNPGLPPTPIANFGLGSLRAALAPPPSDYLFFVADGEGGHRFSRSKGEHDVAAKKYFEQRRRRQRSGR